MSAYHGQHKATFVFHNVPLSTCSHCPLHAVTIWWLPYKLVKNLWLVVRLGWAFDMVPWRKICKASLLQMHCSQPLWSYAICANVPSNKVHKYVFKQQLNDLKQKLESGDSTIGEKLWLLYQYQINDGNALPSLFITASCAEFHFESFKMIKIKKWQNKMLSYGLWN